MATGAYDANGIWNYGEDDNIALFSDTLNLLADSTSDAFTSDRSRIGTLEAGSLSGLIPVAPTSVTKTGGTSSVSTNGTVTFAGVSTISLNGVFTSLYNNYLVIMSKANASASVDIYTRLRAVGTDSSVNYYAQTITVNGGSVSGVSDVNINALVFGIAGATAATSYSIANVYQPKLASVTTFDVSLFGAPSGYIHKRVGGYHGAANSYDGITIYPASGNFTGTVLVFGYNQ